MRETRADRDGVSRMSTSNPLTPPVYRDVTPRDSGGLPTSQQSP